MEQDSLLTQFGGRIRQLREAAGKSQEEFAQACGLDRTYISGIERGKRNVSIYNVHVLAKTLGVTLSRLFEGIE